MLKITHPPGYQSERSYIYEVIMKEFLGLNYITEVEERSNVKITRLNDRDETEVSVVVEDCLFSTPMDRWLTSSSLPVKPLSIMKVEDSPINLGLTENEVPVLFGNPTCESQFVSLSSGGVHLGLDVFGSAFFMLTRYEEMVNQTRDQKERFPASASISKQEGFLWRPIINEYVEVLWTSLKYLWPRLEKKKRLFRAILSHDVDEPLCAANRTFFQMFKNGVGDVLHRKDPALASLRFQSYLKKGRKDARGDAFNTFDFILTLSEQLNLKSAFYFIAEKTAKEIDGVYTLKDPWIRRLMLMIHERGHEIGLHPSYHTYNNPKQVKHEFETLLKTANELGIKQSVWGGRQHFLRWEAPITWQAWDDAGLHYDSTLGYADEPGFRCGVCYEFPVYNLLTKQALKLRERPLIVMEQSLLNPDYLHLSMDEAWNLIWTLINRCKHYDGDFTLLWHNSMLVKKKQADLYRRIVMKF